MSISGIDKHEALKSFPNWVLERNGTSAEHGRCARILVVFACVSHMRNIKAALGGFRCELIPASSASQATELLSRLTVDLVLVDVGAPERDGLELCRLLKTNPLTQLLPVYVLGESNDSDAEIRALEAGADEFLTKPLRPRAFQARIHASLRHKSMVDSLDDSEAVLFSLAQSVEDRDPDLGQHCHRLAQMGAAMGLTLGLPAREILALQRGGYLHDIGKVAVPDHVLFKPGPLTPEEWETMKMHTERGERICAGMKSLASVLPIIRSHHERWDGSGYPDRLAGEEIPLLARVLQLADIYDALTTARPYKSAMTPEKALDTIREEARKGWRDPRLVELFGDVLPMFRSSPVATDHSHFSLHALASSIERFREQPKPIASHTTNGKLQLASGF